MHQLSGAEAGMLYAEHGTNFNHVALLAIYDPASSPRGKLRFKNILAHFERSLDTHPVFRRRLVEVPFGLDRPWWIEDPAVDVEFHVRHIALPEPGDWRQLMIQIARLHSRPLDRGRPQWEVYVIDRLDNIPGLPAGCFAMFMKLHHAAVDGMAALHLLETLHTRDPEAVVESAVRNLPLRETEPAAVELAARAAFNAAGRAFTLGRLGAATLQRAAKYLREREPGESASLLPDVKRPPPTRFAKPVSAHRVVEGTGLPLAAIKRLRERVPGVTINDVFLAVSGGALRKYLQASGELPPATLNALMPISLRTDASAGGNDVSGVPVSLATDIADPLERLNAVREASRTAMRSADVLGRDLLKDMMNALPNALSEMLLNRLVIPQLSTAVSNVRGPEGPLYLAGAQLLRIYPVSIPADYVGINHTAVSFAGTFWIGVVSCREMLPDPAFYMQCLREAFDELLAAAGIAAAHGPAFDNAPAGTRKRARKTPAASRIRAAGTDARRSARGRAKVRG